MKNRVRDFRHFCGLLAAAALLIAGTAEAAITYVGSTSIAMGSGNADTITLTYPAGVAENDILIAQIVVREDENIATPAGWTFIDSRNNGSRVTQAVFWKRARATDPATQTWSYGEDRRSAGTLTAYRGVDPFFPISAWSENSNGSSTSVTAASVTPTVVGVRLVAAMAVAHGGVTFTQPAGMSEREDIASGAGPNGVGAALADEAYAGGLAATGVRTATTSSAADSVAHLIALRPNVIANYRMDETSWTSASGQVVDSSGRGYDANAMNGATTSGTTPAVPGSPGTCSYGVFDGSNDHVALPASFPNLTTDFTITAWIRTTDNTRSGQRIFVDDQNNSGGYGFSLGDGGTGRVRFFARATNAVILDTLNVIQNNTWYFVAAVADISSSIKRIYVYDQAGTQIASVSQTFTGTWGTDAGAASIGGENNASSESSASFRFHGNLDEVSVYSGALSAASVQAVMNQTRACLTTPTPEPDRFNAFDSGTAAGSVSGVIRTKVAANAFALDVVALKTNGTAIETAFAGGVRLELVDASVGGSCSAYGLINPLGTLTFSATDQGRKTFSSISEPNAWPNARIRISYPATGTPTIVACSTDNFAIRPASFGSLTASDGDSSSAGTTRVLNNTGANGNEVHKAGRPFTVAATVLPASATNYNGTPTAMVSACSGSGCPSTLGTVTLGGTVASGAFLSTSASYSEAGAFTLQLQDQTFAAVDADDTSGDCTATGRYVCSAEVAVGRFVPDHFDLTLPNTPQFKTFNDTTCATRSFTYVGQPFGYLTLPQATVTAKNASGDTTTNYSGALWKLTAADAIQTYAAASGTLDTGLIGTPVLVEAGGGTGTLTAHADDVLAYTRGAPVVPFNAQIDLSMSVRDDAENGVTGNGTIDTTTPALFDDIAFDAGNEFRFGQLVLANAHGSELLALPMLIEAKYWNGTGFTRNTADHCTQLAAGRVALTSWRRDLAACETSVTLAGRFASGRGNLRLSAPGAGNTGSVDLTVNLDAVGGGSVCVGGVATPATGAAQTWLQGGTGYAQNPAARASFGLHRSSRALIYIREMY